MILTLDRLMLFVEFELRIFDFIILTLLLLTIGIEFFLLNFKLALLWYTYLT